MSILNPEDDAKALAGAASELVPQVESAVEGVEDRGIQNIKNTLDGLEVTWNITMTISRKK